MQRMSDAVSVTTAYLGGNSEEAGRIAREVTTQYGWELGVAQAHLAKVILDYATDLAAAVEGEGIRVAGIPNGVTPETLLQELARQFIAHNLDEG